MDVGAQTVDAPAKLTYRPLTATEIPVLPASFQATGKLFDLTGDAALLKSIGITVQINAADAVLALAAMNPT